jgi:hypothetical protein
MSSGRSSSRSPAARRRGLTRDSTRPVVKPLREWSARRLLIASVVWLVGLPILVSPALFGAVGWLARAERERGAAAAADSNAPGLRVTYLPPRPDDFSLVTAGPGPALVFALFLLPPVALWITWMLARRRRSEQLTPPSQRHA